MATMNGQAKGYQIKDELANLIFGDDSPEAGLQVKTRLNVPLGVYLEIQDLLAQDRALEMFTLFARVALVSWNILDKEGGPVPATEEGIKQVPVPLATRILQEWQSAVANPPAPLAETSPNGGTSAAPATPLGT